MKFIVNAIIVIFPLVLIASNTDSGTNSDEGSVPSGLYVLSIIVLAGAFGGFVDGLSTRKPYTFSFKGKQRISDF
jgi:hypothetical protein